MMKKSLVGIAISMGVGFALMVPVVCSSAPAVESIADSQGNLHVPADYRRRYEFLGSWAIASEQGAGSKEMHVVYASPGTVAAFRKTGKFPDNAVLVKEVFGTVTAAMATGTAVSHSERLKGWFVMAKDSRGAHAGRPLWADGWGWSWFDAGNPRVTTSKSYKSDCQGCHIPAAASDRVYIQGYPILKH